MTRNIQSMGDTYLTHYPDNPRGVGAPVRDARGRIVDRFVLVTFRRLGAAAAYIAVRPSRSRGMSVSWIPCPAVWVDGVDCAENTATMQNALKKSMPR